MERSTILRWIIIAVAIWLAWTYLPKFWGGGEGGTSALQPIGRESTCSPVAPCAPEHRAEQETLCDIQGVRYKAQLSSRGASLKHFWLEGDRYQYNKTDLDHRKAVAEASPASGVILPDVGHPIDLVTSPAVEQRRPLRFEWRGAGADGADAQVQYDAFDWQLAEKSDKHCVFTYNDDRVELRRTVRATERPFELEIEASVKNLSDVKRKHALSVELASWVYEKEVESSLGRQSPFVTTTMCGYDNDTKRMDVGDFEPGDFGDAGFEGGWHVTRGAINFSSVSNFYFAQALMASEPPADACRLQIEERWDHAKFPDKSKDAAHGAMYRARISYPARELDKDATATYKMVAFLGPKERDVLASAAGGTHHLSELVDLGYFSIIAKGLLYFLVWLHGHVGNWGIAIILMTIGVRTLLAPLTWKSIQRGLAMRRLRPEIDAINQKYVDDAQGTNVATMELWKKHKVNPLGGCLPALFQMPVWWALFTSLQTAVELYHTPFLWFRDLSAPDPYYIVPFILGGTMILQQRLMPMQMDPMQQKMMTYVMPLVFTVMMLFLPSGLAIYMLTNSVIGILQQVAIEKYWSGKAPAAVAAGSGITVSEKPSKASGGKK
jgi:YidC/Oxa1 family membrane protein insertase